MIEKGACGQRGGRGGDAIGIGIGLDVSRLVRADAARHAGKDGPDRVGADDRLQLLDERPRGGVAVSLSIHAGIGGPGVEREGRLGQLRGPFAGIERQLDLEGPGYAAGERAGEALSKPARLDERRRDPDVRHLVHRGERRLVEGDGDLGPAVRLLPEARSAGGDRLGDDQLADARVREADLLLDQRQRLGQQRRDAFAPRLVIGEGAHAQVGRAAGERDVRVEVHVVDRPQRRHERQPAGGVLDRPAGQGVAVRLEGVAVDADLVAGRDLDAHLGGRPEAPGREDHHRRAHAELRVLRVGEGPADAQLRGLLETQVVAKRDGRHVDLVLHGHGHLELPLVVLGGHGGRLVVNGDLQLVEDAELAIGIRRGVGEGDVHRHVDHALVGPHRVRRPGLHRVLGGPDRWRGDRGERAEQEEGSPEDRQAASRAHQARPRRRAIRPRRRTRGFGGSQAGMAASTSAR